MKDGDLTRPLDLAEELSSSGWTTYALAEMRRGQEELEGEAAVARLDKITRILAKENASALEAASEMLGRWLSTAYAQKHHLAGPLRLRRALIFKRLEDFEPALKELKKLLELDPTSPALNCLVGNLHAWLTERESAIEYFDKASELADDWWEPRLEKLEQLLFLGCNDKQRWRQVADNSRTLLEKRARSMTDRERLILWIYGAVAEVLFDPLYFDTPGFAKQQFEAGKIQLSPLQREDWDMRGVYRNVVLRHLPEADPKTHSARNALRKLMKEAHEKLMAHAAWEDDAPYPRPESGE